jgi:hypothetical protein
MFPSIQTTDSINPVLYKELRQMHNSSVPWLMVTGIFVIELLTALILYLLNPEEDCSEKIRDINIALDISTMLCAGVILASSFTTTQLSALQRGVDGSEPLWGTSLTVCDVIFGKLKAVLYMDALLVLCMIPLWGIAGYIYHAPNWINTFHCALGIVTVQTAALSCSFYHFQYFNFHSFWMLVLPTALFCILPTACTAWESDVLFDESVIYIAVCLSIIALALCQAYAFLQHTRCNRDLPMRLCILILMPIWLVLVHIYFFLPKQEYNAFCYAWSLPITCALIGYMLWCSFGELLPSRRIRHELTANKCWLCVRLPFTSGAINGIIYSAGLILLIAVTMWSIEGYVQVWGTHLPWPWNGEPIPRCIPSRHGECHVFPRLFVTMLLGWLQYGLFYSGIILFFRQHYTKQNALFALMGIALLLVFIPIPLASIFKLPTLGYFSPFYPAFILANMESAWEMQLRIMPILVIAFALLYKPCKQYFTALRATD